MPRKPRPPAPALTDDADLGAMQELTRTADDLNTVERGIALVSFELGVHHGQFKMAEMDVRAATLKRALVLKQILDGADAWKGAVFRRDDGTLDVVNSFDQLCGLFGLSRSTAHEYIQNIEALGATWLESFMQIGMTTRQLRVLRQLPDDTLEEAKQLAQEGKPDQLYELLEALAEKDTAEHKALTARAEKAEKSAADKDRLLQAKNKKIDELDAELHKKANREWPEQTRAMVEEGFILATDAMRAIETFIAWSEQLHQSPMVDIEDAQRVAAHVLARCGHLVTDAAADLQQTLTQRIEPLAYHWIPTTEQGRDLMRSLDYIAPDDGKPKDTGIPE